MQTYPSDTVCTEERGDIGLRVRNEGRTIGDVGARWHILRLVVFFFLSVYRYGGTTELRRYSCASDAGR